LLQDNSVKTLLCRKQEARKTHSFWRYN
jgi:hypothetical protein